jgi:hypothetical protein
LKPPSESSSAASASGARLAHQTSQSAPKTGIFSTTKRKKIAQNPSTLPSVPPAKVAADGPESDPYLDF